MERTVRVRGVVVHDGKMLCVRLNDYKQVIVLPADNWCTPGGGVDAGEPLIAALEREMLEETGVKAVVGNLLYVQQFVHHGIEQMELFFHITNSQDYLDIDLTKTSHGVKEIAEIKFVDPQSVKLLPTFLSEVDLNEIGTDTSTKIFDFIS